MPKASAQESHQSNRPRLDNALLALRKDSRVLRHRRAFADCFGANPVASALGSSTRRDPGAAHRTYHGWSWRPLKTGTFYFARKRNFLLCLDSLSYGPERPIRSWTALLDMLAAHSRLTQDLIHEPLGQETSLRNETREGGGDDGKKTNL